MILLHLLFLSSLSCCLAQEDDRSLPETEVIIPLVGDTMEPPSQEKPASNSVNVEEILRELRECRQKNRNLNETIDNILEEMADMKEYIVRNEEKITQVQSSMTLLSKDVTDLTEELAGVEDDVLNVSTILTESISDINSTVEKNSAQITRVAEDVMYISDDF